MIRRVALALGAVLVVVGGYFVGREIVRPPLPAAPVAAVEAAQPPAAAVPAAAASAGETAADAAGVTALDEAGDAQARLERRERRRQRLGGDERIARRREMQRERGGALGSRRTGAGFPGRFERPTSNVSMALDQAIREHASGPWVEGQGKVERVMRDDLRGRQHQRFVLELASGETLLVAHNTQLAGRAPVEVGETIRFRGRYEWNARGGVVHWTHRDPRGGSGGWLELAGQRYE